MPTRELRRTPASFPEQLEDPVYILQLVLRTELLGDLEQPECLNTEELEYPRHTAARVLRTPGTEAKSDIETPLSTNSFSHI